MALRLRRGTDAERVTITPQAGELIYVIDTKKVWVGDGLTQGGIPVDSTLGSLSINDLTDVDTTTAAPQNGEALVWNSVDQEWQPQPVLTLETDPTVNGNLKVNIVGDDSTLLVDSDNNVLRGEFAGNVFGPTFASDSRLLVDTVNRRVLVNTAVIDEIIEATQLQLRFLTTATGDDFRIKFETPERAKIQLTKTSTVDDLLLSGNPYGSVDFAKDDINGTLVTSRISGGRDYVFMAADPNGDLLANEDYVMFWERKFGIGTRRPEKTLDVRGDAVIHGGLTADVTGSLFFDDSARVFDATDGTMHIANVDIVGQTGNTPSTPGSVDSYLEVTVNGVTKYLPLYV